MKKTSREVSQETTTDQSVESLAARRSRRSLLKGTVAGVAATAGISGLSAYALSAAHAEVASAHGSGCVDSFQTILTVARTLERLAVTFVGNGVKHAEQLGLSGATLANVKAVVVEEQIHELFLADHGAGVLASDFSFPHGPESFTDIKTFLQTLAEIGGVFDTVYLAATKEFAELGRPDWAQVAAQIAWVEGEHLALGRQIGINIGLLPAPANNWAFAPSLMPSVGALPAIAKKEGYLSPRPGNHYTYHQASIDDSGVVYRKPFAASCS